MKDEDEDEDVDLARFWILNPKINDDVPINKETIVRTFCVRPGIRVIGVFVYCCCCCPSAYTKEANRLFIINTGNDNRIAVTIEFICRLYQANDNHCLYDDPKGNGSPL
jgi:hypothetical protein